MKMTKVYLSSLVALSISLTTTMAMAISVSLDPASITGSVGDGIFVDLVWNGNGGASPIYIGDFDVDIQYDDSVVSYQGATIDPDFGVDSLGCFICGDVSTPGTIDLFEVSFDLIPDLIANQDGLGNMFLLATLEFEGLTDGHTDLILSGIFGDESAFIITPTLTNGEIWIETSGIPIIPEPSSILLLVTGLAGLTARRTQK